MSQINTRVKARLQALGIKLWLEPYYCETNGRSEAAIEELAKDFNNNLGISLSTCKLTLTTLQDNALRKLAARKEYESTGVATLSVRRIDNNQGTGNIFEVKCSLTILGNELLKMIAKDLNITQPHRIKCIVAGKKLNDEQSLLFQGIKNGQQLMVIVSELDDEATLENAMLDRIQKIKYDIELIVDSRKQFFEIEDQDGNPIFVPPAENRALLMALGFYEKARAAMKREHYDEALILLLEADEKFSNCNSELLEMVDNYALVNLDIVWCYLCLKNVTQLPDAHRRLDICEKSFHRSYGEQLQRLITLKGSGSTERALIMRLHLLQGVVLFYESRHNEAHAKLIEAEKEMRLLKVDENAVQTLVEMGFEFFEARLGLRACHGNIEEAINYIHEWHEKRKQNRKRSENQRKLNKELARKNKDKNWVNPSSVCALMEMGFIRDLVVQALRMSKNDLTKAVDLLQHHSDVLNSNLSPVESTAGPSTSRGVSSSLNNDLDAAADAKPSMVAYERFKEELNQNDFDYLDLPLMLEEQILNEYKQLLQDQ